MLTTFFFLLTSGAWQQASHVTYKNFSYASLGFFFFFRLYFSREDSLRLHLLQQNTALSSVIHFFPLPVQSVCKQHFKLYSYYLALIFH